MVAINIFINYQNIYAAENQDYFKCHSTSKRIDVLTKRINHLFKNFNFVKKGNINVVVIIDTQ